MAAGACPMLPLGLCHDFRPRLGVRFLAWTCAVTVTAASLRSSAVDRTAGTPFLSYTEIAGGGKLGSAKVPISTVPAQRSRNRSRAIAPIGGPKDLRQQTHCCGAEGFRVVANFYREHKQQRQSNCFASCDALALEGCMGTHLRLTTITFTEASWRSAFPR